MRGMAKGACLRPAQQPIYEAQLQRLERQLTSSPAARSAAAASPRTCWAAAARPFWRVQGPSAAPCPAGARAAGEGVSELLASVQGRGGSGGGGGWKSSERLVDRQTWPGFIAAAPWSAPLRPLRAPPGPTAVLQRARCAPAAGAPPCHSERRPRWMPAAPLPNREPRDGPAVLCAVWALPSRLQAADATKCSEGSAGMIDGGTWLLTRPSRHCKRKSLQHGGWSVQPRFHRNPTLSDR